MLIYIGFDDTDTKDSDRGTGKLARWFGAQLPEGCRLWGVIRQQLPRLEGIPYTSNNSAACVVVQTEDAGLRESLTQRAVAHIEEHFIEGSDPGLCVLVEGDGAVQRLVSFGRDCCVRRVTQSAAMTAAAGVHLSGHGGTNDGVIGAAAGVGLTLYGWSGRFVEFGDLRGWPDPVAVGTLEEAGIRVLDVARDALVPGFDDMVETEGWLRPRLWGGRPVLPVRRLEGQRWKVDGTKGARAASVVSDR
jgi:hypothetical protein